MNEDLGKVSIDIVVPTVRVDWSVLRRLAYLDLPDGMEVHCIFVVDDPHAEHANLGSCLDGFAVTVIENEANFGAHVSRNRGLEAEVGDYVLFLDDDTEVPPDLLATYLKAIREYPDAPGFVGPVKFPAPFNSFTGAAVASDILTFWDIAENMPSLGWGITANLLVRRTVVGDICFSSRFPKKGGGEDVDFCLRLVEKTGKWFISVPSAVVVHQWWDGGSYQYRRFARWAYGDSSLPVLHPSYKFRNAPNFIETALLSFLLGSAASVFMGASLTWFAVWLIIAFFLELAMDGFRMRLEGKRVGLLVSVQATLIRLSNDLGRIAGHLKHLHFLGIGERFDYFMTGEHIAYERRVAVTQFIVFAVVAAVLFAVLS